MVRRKKKPSFTREDKRKGKILNIKPANMSAGQLEAISTLSEYGISQGVRGFRQVSYKIAGMENAEETKTVLTRSKIPSCIADFLDEYQVEAMSMFHSLYEARLPSLTVDLKPRMGGGGNDGDNYDEDAIDAYDSAKRAFMGHYRRKEGKRALKELEWLITRPHKAVLNVDQRCNAGHYANKLKQVFGVEGE